MDFIRVSSTCSKEYTVPVLLSVFFRPVCDQSKAPLTLTKHVLFPKISFRIPILNVMRKQIKKSDPLVLFMLDYLKIQQFSNLFIKLSFSLQIESICILSHSLEYEKH